MPHLVKRGFRSVGNLVVHCATTGNARKGINIAMELLRSAVQRLEIAATSSLLAMLTMKASRKTLPTLCRGIGVCAMEAMLGGQYLDGLEA
jgi:hypothetical protein